jgi:hypothetical protein
VQPAPAAKPLPEALLEVLRREGESRPEGVPLAVLFEQFKGSSTSEVRNVLDKLVTDGEAFQTLDDEHFQAL